MVHRFKKVRGYNFSIVDKYSGEPLGIEKTFTKAKKEAIKVGKPAFIMKFVSEYKG